MNERIKELLDKAEVYYNDDMYSDYNDLASLQKFAELIIQEFAYECIDVTNQGERIQWIAKKWGISI